MATNKNLTANVEEAAKPLQLSEGTRQDLLLRGHAISPFTGALLVGSGSHDVREVSKEEYLAVAKARTKREADAREAANTNVPRL